MPGTSYHLDDKEATMTAGPPDAAALPALLPMEVKVRKQPGGAVLRRRPLGTAEMLEFIAEVWLRGFLRQGFADVPLDAVPIEMFPIPDEHAPDALAGFSIHTVNPAGKKSRLDFTKRAVEQTVLQLVQELIAASTLQLGDHYHYELTLGKPDEGLAEAAPQEGRDVVITTQTATLNYTTVRLAPLLSNSTAIGPHEDDVGQVFYTERAFEAAERFSRQGGNHQPPIETGCMAIGTLCSCPQSGEFFVIVSDVLEAQDAESKKFSLSYSGKTWNRLQSIVRARRAQPGMAALRFVGQAHGHPFLPLDGAPPCDVCLQQKECPRHSCFVSVDDNAWSRAVFPRQPWQLCHIFGLNARGDQVNKLFGQHNGMLVERGYRIIPEFDLQSVSSVESHNESS